MFLFLNLDVPQLVAIAICIVGIVIFWRAVGETMHSISIAKHAIEKNVALYADKIDCNSDLRDSASTLIEILAGVHREIEDEKKPPVLPPDPIDIELENENKWLADFDNHVRQNDKHS